MLGKRIWILAILVCVLLGATVAAIEVGADAGGVDVPRLRIGDVATYVFYDERGEALGVRTFEATEMAVAYDRQTFPRWVVKIASAFEDINSTVEEWVDQSDGSVIRVDHRTGQAGFREVISSFEERETIVPFLTTSGSSLKPEDTWYSAGAYEKYMAWWSREGGAVNMRWMRCAPVDTSVAGMARVDGRVTLELRSLYECDGNAYGLSVWLGNDASFPTLIEFRGPDGGWLRASLAGFERGTGSEATWSAPRASGRGRDLVSAPSLSADLSEAITAVQGDEGLAGFQSWRAQHAGSVLVGARLNRGEHATDDAESVTWRMLFAHSSGSAFEVAHERGAVNKSTDRGLHNVTPFDPNAFEGPPESFEHALKAWKFVRSEEFANTTPNLVRWGVDFPISWDPDCPHVPASTGLLPVSGPPGIVHVGYSTFGTCTVPKVERSESYIAYDLEEGAVGPMVEHRIRLDAFPSGRVERQAAPWIESVPEGFVFRQPDVVAVTLWGTGFFAVFLATYFFPTLKLFLARGLGVLGFTRLQRDDLLDNQVREGLVEAVTAEPGVAAMELKERLGIGWGTAAYHLAVLEREGLVSSLQYGRNRCFFPPGAGDARDRARLILLRNPTTRAIHESILSTPGTIQEELAKRFQMTSAGVLWHLRRLQEAGLVTSRKTGRKVHYFASGGGTRP